MPPKPLNVALVGFGYAGLTFHAPLVTAAPSLALHTIVSSRPDDASALWPAARIVADVSQALDDPAVDLVVIATPNALHAHLAARALQAGKHVVVDKPFTLTVAEARDLKALAERRGRVLSVFHNRRWDADFLAIQALIADGALGRVSSFESRFDRFRPERRDRWRERPEPGAGLWFDLGPHLIDQALVLFGRPLAVTADLAVQRDGDGAPDYVHAILRYERLRVVLHADMLSPAHDLRFRIQGDRAAYVKAGLDPQEDALKAGRLPGDAGWGLDPNPGRIVSADGAAARFQGPPGDYRRYYAAVADAMRGLGPNPVPPDQAIAVMEIIEAGMLSTERRAEVAL